MPRPRHALYAGQRPAVDVLMALRMGPTKGDGLTQEDLQIGWEVYGERVMEEGRIPGTRPWGWWRFVARERPPAPDTINQDFWRLETVRLAELGELSADELAALREDANVARIRIGTPAERFSGGGREYGVPVDRRDVELWERVEAALGR